VTVNGSGQATVSVAAKDAVAIDVDAKVSGTTTVAPTTPAPTTPAGT
jgi:alpha-amylase